MTSMRDATMLLLGDLVGFPTVTSESNLDLIQYVSDHLAPLGADIRVTFDETGAKANLLATFGPLVDGGVILSGHSDVVPAEEVDWTGAPFLAMRRDQKIYGRGTADMKGFIACAMAVAESFATAPLLRPLHIAVTYDEEIGCKGAPVLIEDLVQTGIRPAAAIVGEPTGMGVVTAHKGCYEYTTIIVGREGHGSAPDDAVNAVQVGSRFIAKLLDVGGRLRSSPPAKSPYTPPHTTISVGMMQGGTARNIVAGECVIEWEMRPVVRSDAAMVLEEITSFETELLAEMHSVDPATTIVTYTEGDVDGLEDEESYAADLAGRLVGSEERHVVSFGTEAGLYQMAGIPAVVCGPGEIDVAHRPDEYVSLDQLEQCLSMMESIVPILCNPR